MHLELHPQISRLRRQTAVEQTCDLLRAYLESRLFGHGESEDDADNHLAELSTGFFAPQRRSA
jgi:hypothetical protein